jgi:sulfite reductase alpha subunit-like flavoprotein
LPCVCRKIYIVYGSQTGNAESIAKELAGTLSKFSTVECSTLNTIKGKRLQETCLFLIVLCSTTGNGDCPENADPWWRSIKIKSAVRFFTLISLLDLSSVVLSFSSFLSMLYFIPCSTVYFL